MTRDRFAYIFCVVVSVCWVIVLGASLLTKDYTALTVMTPLLMLVGGFLLGYGPKEGGQ